jgi:hypothetical protein
LSLVLALPAGEVLGSIELVGGTWSFPDPNDGTYPPDFNTSQDDVEEASWLALEAFTDPALYYSGQRLVLLAKIEANSASSGGFSVTYAGGASKSSGAWSSPVPVSFVSVKVGNADSRGPLDITNSLNSNRRSSTINDNSGPGGFALYEYDAAATGGSWNTNELSWLSGGNGVGRAVSHISFWGLEEYRTGMIPEPASIVVWLAIGVCVTLVGIRRRRAHQA